MTDKVSEDAAALELDRFAEAMELDLDKSRMDPDDVEAYERHRRVFIGAVMKGNLIVNDEGQPMLKMMDGTDLTFREPTGAMLMEMDKVKKGDVAKSHALMKSMCQVAPDVFAKMPSRRYKVAQTIVALFLG